MTTEIQLITDQTLNIIQKAPVLISETQNAITANTESMTLCNEEGERLLSRAEGGMTDELDKDIAAFIKRANATVKSMTDRRKNVTQMFDMIKKGFTNMENLVSMKNNESVVCKLQAKRNAYAAKILAEKRAREEERRREESRKQAKIKFLSDAKMALCALVLQKTTSDITVLGNVFSGLTLDNAKETKKKLEGYAANIVTLDEFLGYAKGFAPSCITEDESKSILFDAFQSSEKDLSEKHLETVLQARDEYLLKFDSKVQELEKISALGDSEKEYAFEQIKNADNADMDCFKQAALNENARQNEMFKAERATAEAKALFDQTTAYNIDIATKAKVSKKLSVADRDGWLAVIQQWWSSEGALLPLNKLASKLEFMRKACEKQANKEEIYIKSSHVSYSEDVTAG